MFIVNIDSHQEYFNEFIEALDYFLKMSGLYKKSFITLSVIDFPI